MSMFYDEKFLPYVRKTQNRNIFWNFNKCKHKEHNPPDHLYNMVGHKHSHICPGCNKLTVVKR